MADGSDPFKNATNTQLEESNPSLANNQLNFGINGRRPSYNSVWKRRASTEVIAPVFPSVEQQPKSFMAKTRSLFSMKVKSSTPSSDAVHYNSQKSFPPANLPTHLPKDLVSLSGHSDIRVVESRKIPYWESGEGYYEGWNPEQSGTYLGENGIPEEVSGDYHERYYTYEKPHKRKGISFKIDRFVQRFPALGKFYKQSLTSPEKIESNGTFTYDQLTGYVSFNQLTRELTDDELALHERYSNQMHMKLINLRATDQTQPVDLRVHQKTNKIYLCDVGRCLTEIYDYNGTLQHVIDDPTMTKFQPTAIAVAANQTIVLASHFNHCLHMYLPSDIPNATNRYTYKQFKLGRQGNQFHQFYNPAGIALDNIDGNLYICDRGNYRIQVIRPAGVCERVIELVVNIAKKYPLDPIRIALQQTSEQLVCLVGTGDAICFLPKHASGKLYVNPLCVLDENGLGLEGASGIATDVHDRIFISDTGHHRIVICAPDGSYITSFGTEGDGLGQLKRPCGLDVTADGTMIVTDPGNKRLQFFGFIQEQPVNENNPPMVNSTEKEDDLFLSL